MSQAPEGRERSRSAVSVEVVRVRKNRRDEDDNQSEDSQPPRPYKRLVVCCDGTWLDSNSGLQDGKLVPPSNVTRMTRAVRPTSKEGIQQIIYYQAGVGSSGSLSNKVIGGATGDGVADNVREAYVFLANNWEPGDEIFLLGFSRGAFTARSVAGLIGDLGLLSRAGLASFPIIYKDWAHRNTRNYRSSQPDVPFRDKPSMRDPMYVQTLERRGLTRRGVRIRAVAVWDTVGSLGIPRVSWLGRFGKRTLEEQNEYAFYDTTLDACVDNAFQALGLDERRSAFSPSLWELSRSNDRTNLIQVWFPGVHSNVGGGYDDQELANITLAWMIAMLSPLLDIDQNYILVEDRENENYYASKRLPVRPWSFGKIYDSISGFYEVGGSVTRTPGQYCRTDPRNGNETNKPLRNTNEYIHASVRSRTVKEGPGYDDRGIYEARALRDWKLRSEKEVEGLPTPWFWELRARGEAGGRTLILPEAPLRTVEKLLLRNSPEIEDFVLAKPQPARSRRRRTAG